MGSMSLSAPTEKPAAKRSRGKDFLVRIATERQLLLVVLIVALLVVMTIFEPTTFMRTANAAVVLLDNPTFPLRLKQIFDDLRSIIIEHRPDEVAIERVFMARNPDSALKLGQARGAAICAAVIAWLPVAEYTALQVKQAVVGAGHAKKEQVQHMVKRLLALPGDPGADAAEALACAICHAQGGRLGHFLIGNLTMKKGRLV